MLEYRLIELLKHIWGQLVQAQRDGTSKDKDLLFKTKIEVIFCVGNCTTAVSDALYMHGLELLIEAVSQGAIKILVEALSYEFAKTCSFGLKIALDSIAKYFGFYKHTLKLNSTDAEVYGNAFQQLKDEFEFKLGGLDVLERCQFHEDKQVYRMS